MTPASTVEEGLRAGVAEGLHIGAQVVASLQGELVVDLAVGDAASGRPMTTDTLMPWFSCTKLATAAAVAQQWERNALALDDPVAAFVPEFAAAGKGAVTVRHLLTHTGGFPKAGGGPAIVLGETWDETLASVCAAPLEDGWVPGRRAAYHPRGSFFVLGELVRRIDGRPFDAYVAEELFEPLGMADAWLSMTADRYRAYGERMGVMHVTARGRCEPLAGIAGPDAYERVNPGGGAVGPPRDLLRLVEMLLGLGELDGVRVLSPQTAEAMCARHRTSTLDETFGAVIDWGLGLMVNSWHYREQPAPYGYGDHASRRAFGHGGSQSSVAFADPEHGLAAVLVFNGMPGEPAHHRRSQPVLSALYEDLGLAPSNH